MKARWHPGPGKSEQGGYCTVRFWSSGGDAISVARVFRADPDYPMIWTWELAADDVVVESGFAYSQRSAKLAATKTAESLGWNA